LKTYRTLLFDVDNTLLDFEAAEKLALYLLFKERDMLLTDAIEADYKRINHGLWKSYEEGVMGRDEVVNTRFSRLFGEYGLVVDGAEMDRLYRSYLEEGHQLVDGAMELITDLHDGYDLYLVTNGVSETQHRRLRASGLYPFFKGTFVSEDTGYQKPMKAYFDYVFARIPKFKAEHALVIGDSLTADIKGGQLAGLDTCWFNPEGKPNDTGIVPTYEIRRLDELYEILSAGE